MSAELPMFSGQRLVDVARVALRRFLRLAPARTPAHAQRPPSLCPAPIHSHPALGNANSQFLCSHDSSVTKCPFTRGCFPQDVEEWVDLQREAFLVYPKPDEADELQPIGPIEVLPPVASSGENDLQHRDAEQHGKGAAKDPGASGRGQAKASVR